MVNDNLSKKIVYNVIALYSIGKIIHGIVKFHKNIKKIKENPTKNGGRLVANTLKAYGIEYVFTLTGGHISPILVECERQNIKIIDTRHEVTTVYAADAMARITGKCGVAIVTSGPGLTNTVTAVKNAQLAESPVLIISGTAPIVQHNRGALQDIDHVGLMKTLCKYSVSVQSVRDIVPQLKKAMVIALSGVPGPVYLEMPYDVLYSYEHVTKALMPTATQITSPFGEISLLIRHWKLINIYYQAWEKYSYDYNIDTNNDSNNDKSKVSCYKPLEPIIPRCPHMTILAAKRLLENANRPILIIGSQAMLPPVTAEQLKAAVLELGIPTFMSGMARGLLSDGPEDQTDKNIQYRFVRRQALAEADLVIIAGLPCDFRMGYGRGINKTAKVIIVNRSFEALMMNSDIYWKPTLSVHSDVGTFITKLSNSITHKQFQLPNSFNDHLRELENKEKEKLRQKVEEAEKNSVNSKKVNPLVFLSKFNKRLLEAENNKNDLSGNGKKKNVIVVVDGGDFIGTAAKFIWPSRPLQWLDPGLFGTLGVGGGFALAAAILASQKSTINANAITNTSTSTNINTNTDTIINTSVNANTNDSINVNAIENINTNINTSNITTTTTTIISTETETEVWILYGDGTAGYSLAEVDTFTRHQLPINICIGNDSCWTQVARQQKPLFNGCDVACPLEDRHYEIVGEGYGGKGLLIGQCEEEEDNKDKEEEKVADEKIKTNSNDSTNANASIDEKLEEYLKLREQYPKKPIVMNVLIDGKSIESFRQTSKYV